MTTQDKEAEITNKVVQAIEKAKEIKDHFVVTVHDGYSVYTINNDLRIEHFTVMYKGNRLIQATTPVWEALDKRQKELKEELTNQFLNS